jgi:hypothetical protein
MGHGAWGVNCEFRIANFETGNPPEGWESVGQFEITERETRGNGETETLRIAEFLADS